MEYSPCTVYNLDRARMNRASSQNVSSNLKTILQTQLRDVTNHDVV